MEIVYPCGSSGIDLFCALISGPVFTLKYLNADLVRASMPGVFWRDRTGNYRVIGTIQNGARCVSSSRSATGAMVIDESKLKADSAARERDLSKRRFIHFSYSECSNEYFKSTTYSYHLTRNDN
jgi:hypothetical protein